MKNIVFGLIIGLSVIGIQQKLAAQDTICYLDPSFSFPDMDRIMAGDSLYVKFTHASNYIGTWEASENGYTCQIQFSLTVISAINLQLEFVVGKFRLEKADTLIIDHLHNTDACPDFCIRSTENPNGLKLIVSPTGLVSLSGEFEMLNEALNSAKLTLRSDEGIYIKQSEQREWIRREILKFFAPGVIFTRKER